MTGYSGKFRLCQLSDFPKLPAMRWFIQNLVPRYGITLLYGEAKVGKKTFIGMSLACAIASGTNWCGFPTIKGKVLYISGEGFYGLLRRQAAWEHLHDIAIGNDLRFLRVPINFYDENEVKTALAALKTQGFIPDFVIIDTLAKSMSGGKENVTEDMSTVFQQIDLFRANIANDIGIAIIHHTGKDGLNYRGSSVIKGAVDALIMTKADNLEISLTSKGYKDAADFEPFKVRCETVEVETEDGLEIVLVVKERITKPAANVVNKPSLSNGAAELLSLLAKLPNGATFAEWRKTSALPVTTFKRYRKELLTEKLVAIAGVDRGAKYFLAPQPQPTPDKAHNKDQLGTRATPFRSVAPIGPNEPGPRGPDLGPSGPLAPSSGCENVDTTSNGENLNENNKGEATMPEPDLVAEALKQIATKRTSPSGKSAWPLKRSGELT